MTISPNRSINDLPRVLDVGESPSTSFTSKTSGSTTPPNLTQEPAMPTTAAVYYASIPPLNLSRVTEHGSHTLNNLAASQEQPIPPIPARKSHAITRERPQDLSKTLMGTEILQAQLQENLAMKQESSEALPNGHGDNLENTPRSRQDSGLSSARSLQRLQLAPSFQKMQEALHFLKIGSQRISENTRQLYDRSNFDTASFLFITHPAFLQVSPDKKQTVIGQHMQQMSNQFLMFVADALPKILQFAAPSMAMRMVQNQLLGLIKNIEKDHPHQDLRRMPQVYIPVMVLGLLAVSMQFAIIHNTRKKLMLKDKQIAYTPEEQNQIVQKSLGYSDADWCNMGDAQKNQLIRTFHFGQKTFDYLAYASLVGHIAHLATQLFSKNPTFTLASAAAQTLRLLARPAMNAWHEVFSNINLIGVNVHKNDQPVYALNEPNIQLVSTGYSINSAVTHWLGGLMPLISDNTIIQNAAASLLGATGEVVDNLNTLDKEIKANTAHGQIMTPALKFNAATQGKNSFKGFLQELNKRLGGSRLSARVNYGTTAEALHGAASVAQAFGILPAYLQKPAGIVLSGVHALCTYPLFIKKFQGFSASQSVGMLPDTEAGMQAAAPSIMPFSALMMHRDARFTDLFQKTIAFETELMMHQTPGLHLTDDENKVIHMMEAYLQANPSENNIKPEELASIAHIVKACIQKQVKITDLKLTIESFRSRRIAYKIYTHHIEQSVRE